MKKNMGNIDRIVRIAIAIILIALNAKGLVSGGTALTAIIIAVTFLVTTIFGFCPVYKLFGVNRQKII